MFIALAGLLGLAFVNMAAAQVRVPRESQKAGLMQTIGVTDITITYSRPAVKGRAIWGEAVGEAKGTATLDDGRSRPKNAPIVPYGHVWRTGANEATTFATTDDVLINGQKLAAGTYSLHTIPGKDEWTIIFNSDAGQWGSFAYDEKKDALRVKAKPEAAPMQETLLFTIGETKPDAARFIIHWEKIAVPFTVSIPDVNALVVSKARAAVAAAKADDWRTPMQAAGYCLQNKLNTEEAWGWLEKSIGIKATYQNLGLKARSYAAMGKTAEAIAAGEKAIAAGKADAAKPDTAPLEKLVAEWKAKK
jgi:hypothetical protein